jgi:hypothetical protein
MTCVHSCIPRVDIPLATHPHPHPSTNLRPLFIHPRTFGHQCTRDQVLDGVPITAADQAAARAKYAGRLTLEMLEERLGHRQFERTRDLDMSGLKVQSVSCLHRGMGSLLAKGDGSL